MTTERKPHSGSGFQEGRSARFLAAFRDWAMRDDGDDRANWEIERRDARRLFEQLEAAKRGGAGLIAAERQRQIDSEGWDAGHDDAHDQGEMAKAAAAYALASYGSAHAYEYWPWHADWWRPRDRIGTLVKAGALIAAEIDRLERAASSPASRQDA